MNYRASKSFKIALSALVPLGIALYCGLVPELEAMRRPKVPGDLTFPEKRPDLRSGGKISSTSSSSLDWLDENWDKLKRSEHFPWKMESSGFGRHYGELYNSKDPMDRAKLAFIERQAAAIYKQLVARYPELAVLFRNVPPERNGYLKWMEFVESCKNNRWGNKDLGFPQEIREFREGKASWNAEVARKWLEENQDLVARIRDMGLLPDASVSEADTAKQLVIPARLAMDCALALMLETRLALESGDVDKALRSIQAAKGLGDHLAKVEVPYSQGSTISILIQRDLERRAFEEWMPLLPEGSRSPELWEQVLNPTVAPPSEFGRLMKANWTVSMRAWLLPVLADVDDPEALPDSAEMADAYASGYAGLVDHFNSEDVSDLSHLSCPPSPDFSHLTWKSREMLEIFSIGEASWFSGWKRAQSNAAMTQAAFAVMKGEPAPNDPIYGLPYRWDPETRTLTAPDSPAFKEMGLKPIKVPRK